MAKDRGVGVRAGYPVDMAHLFRAWFTWGFWGSIIQILVIAVFVPLFCLYKNSYKVSQTVFMVMQGLSCCSTFMWFVLGFFWRFSKGGRVAAGDKLERIANTSDDDRQEEREKASLADGYQLKGGKFMSAFLWLIISAVLIAVAVGSILSVVMCMNGDKDIKFDLLKETEEDVDEKQALKEEGDNSQPKAEAADEEQSQDKQV